MEERAWTREVTRKVRDESRVNKRKNCKGRMKVAVLLLTAALCAGFRCGDGVLVPDVYVGDGYCDCADGSDEAGRGVCDGTEYVCENRGSLRKTVPSEYVGDGVCDCCDGSDEANGVCKDVCASETAERIREWDSKIDEARSRIAAREALAAQGRSERAGIKEAIIEAVAAAEAARERAGSPELSKELTPLADRIDKVTHDLDAVTASLASLDDVSTEDGSADAAVDEARTPDGDDTLQVPSKGKRGRGKQDDEKSVKERGRSKDKTEHSGKGKKESRGRKGKKEQEAKGKPEHAEGEGREEERKRELEARQKALEEEMKELKERKRAAESAVEAAEREVKVAERRAWELGEKAQVNPVDDCTYHLFMTELRDGAFVYRYGYNITQYGNILIGKASDSTGVSYSGGDACDVGGKRVERSAHVHISCGASARLVRSTEPSTCRYELYVESPCGCTDELLTTTEAGRAADVRLLEEAAEPGVVNK